MFIDILKTNHVLNVFVDYITEILKKKNIGGFKTTFRNQITYLIALWTSRHNLVSGNFSNVFTNFVFFSGVLEKNVGSAGKKGLCLVHT